MIGILLLVGLTVATLYALCRYVCWAHRYRDNVEQVWRQREHEWRQLVDDIHHIRKGNP